MMQERDLDPPIKKWKYKTVLAIFVVNSTHISWVSTRAQFGKK